MADPVKVNAAPKASKKTEDLQAEQDQIRNELFDARNKGAKPEEVKAIKARLADAVAATRAAEEAQA